MIFLVLLFVYFYTAICHYDDAYFHDIDSDIGDEYTSWLGTLPDSRKLNQLSIPGTHDTMTYSGAWEQITITNVLHLRTQLIGGIRALDIRLKVDGNNLKCYHGGIYLDNNFHDVLEITTAFLKTYTREFIVMRIKDEGGPNFGDVFDTYFYNDPKYSSYFYKTSSSTYIPTLGEMRGKIMIFQQFTGKNNRYYGINWSNTGVIDIQDDYKLGTHWDLYDKWEKVKNQINRANNKGSSNKIYINFLSGSGGPLALPYFVVSGHGNENTDASRLSTGSTDPPNSNKWVDFPRVTCFAGTCTIAFEGTNTLTKNYLEYSNINFNYVGLLFTDFPGRGFVNAVIKVNSGVALPVEARTYCNGFGEFQECPLGKIITARCASRGSDNCSHKRGCTTNKIWSALECDGDYGKLTETGWKCSYGWGQRLACKDIGGSILVGSCGSGSSKDCKDFCTNGESHAIKCAKAEDFIIKWETCIWLTHSDGNWLECPKGYVATGQCGSGGNPDCKGSGSGAAHELQCCQLYTREDDGGLGPVPDEPSTMKTQESEKTQETEKTEL